MYQIFAPITPIELTGPDKTNGKTQRWLRLQGLDRHSPTIGSGTGGVNLKGLTERVVFVKFRLFPITPSPPAPQNVASLSEKAGIFDY